MLIARPILMYHSTAPDPDIRVNVTPDLLSRHLELLDSKGWQCCSIKALLRGDPGCDVGLTFDDGYANNLDIVPLLQEHGAGATFFVLTGSEGETLPHHQPKKVPVMGLAGWQELDAAGFEIAAHGQTHRCLTELSWEERKREIAGSIQTLGDSLGLQEVGYAFPYGSMDRSAYHLARQHAFYACATQYRWPLVENRWRIRRIGVSGRDGVDRLNLKLSLPVRAMFDLGF